MKTTTMNRYTVTFEIIGESLSGYNFVCYHVGAPGVKAAIKRAEKEVLILSPLKGSYILLEVETVKSTPPIWHRYLK